MNRAKYLPVMMYHHVTPEGGMINSTPENFESQLRWLKAKGWTSIRTEDLAAFLDGKALPKKSVLITFDDGYLDNWVYAYPLLKKYGFSAVCFLVTSWLGHGPIRTKLGEEDLPSCPEHKECERLIEEGYSDKVILRWEEVKEMQADGVFEFHSHTHTHTRWDLRTDNTNKNAQIRWELERSREVLKQKLGSVSDHFCWPQGYYDSDYVAIAKEVGFRYLYTTQAFGFNKSNTDSAAIHRFAVRNTHGASVGRRLKLAVSPLRGAVFNQWKLRRQAKKAAKKLANTTP